MQLLQIDVTPAIAVLGIGCLLGVGLKLFEIRANRRASERAEAILRQIDEIARTHTE